jgi:drug/metabolite transporter (DMT)-like permease
VLGAGAAAVSCAAIFARLADEAPPLTIAAYRLLFATVILGGFALARFVLGRDRLPVRTSWPWLALGGALLAAHFWSWFASLEHTSVASSVVIVAMQPLLAGVLGFAFFRERPTRNEGIGIALAVAGLLVIAGRDFASSPGELGGDALALLGSFFAAAYFAVGRRSRSETSATMYSASVYACATVSLWLLAALVHPRVGGFSGSNWTYLVLLAVVPQVIGHTAFNWALGHYRVVTVSMVVLLEPIGATLLAIPALGERPGAAILAGGPLVIAGVYFGLRGGFATDEPAL